MTPKTLFYVVVAILAVSAAVFTAPSAIESDFLEDKGQDFFPEFASADAVASLQVSVFSPRLGNLYRFKVSKTVETVSEEVDGVARQVQKVRWTIPSHHSYPADATEYAGGKDVNRIALEAAAFIGLRKKDVISDDPDAHGEYRVLDPDQPGLQQEGYGRRISFSDADGNELAALIVGKEVPDLAKHHYVRVPGKNRTYVAMLERSISTRFQDWIEGDLLKVNSWDLSALTIDQSTIDEQSFAQIPGEIVEVRKVDEQWQIQDLDPTEETDAPKVSAIATALDSLKIVGVRPKPEDLADLLAGKADRVSRTSFASLQEQGFYPTQSAGLLANEGELIAKTKDGVVYRLMFGEVLYGEGDEVSAGSTDDAEAAETSGAGTSSQAANRYLMILSQFDPSMLDQPAEEPLEQEELDKRQKARREIERLARAVDDYRAVNEEALPGSLAALMDAEGENGEKILDELKKDPWGNDYQLRPDEELGYVLFSLGADGVQGGLAANTDVSTDSFSLEDELREARTAWNEYEDKVAEGEKKAAELSERFAPWYYVVDNQSFETLRASKASLVKAKEVDAEMPEGADAGEGFEPPNPFELPNPFSADGPPVDDGSGAAAESAADGADGTEEAGTEEAGTEAAGEGGSGGAEEGGEKETAGEEAGSGTETGSEQGEGGAEGGAGTEGGDGGGPARS